VEAALALILLLTANGAPILAERVLGPRWSWPIDGGWKFFDGRPLLGKSKTVRGVLAAMMACPAVALLLGLPVGLGIGVALLAMLGDLLSSFIKRRLAIPPSGQALGLDQFPEALLPLWLLHEQLGIELTAVAILTCLFFVIELVLSRVLFYWHIRNRPY